MSKSKIKGCKLVGGLQCEETIRIANSKLRREAFKDTNLPGTSILKIQHPEQ